jgi:serine phosphatase RsbU (regulator of sigma subunit)/pSer/pThr/pTyr-binding forkhead associated (FHA) protein
MSTPRFEWKGMDGSDQVFLISSSEIVIGRKGDADLVVSHQHVSRRHAKLVAVNEGHQLVDLDSTYGTFVNDQRVKRCILRHGDKILFGKDHVEFRYFVEEPVSRPKQDTTQIIQKSLMDLNRVLPSAASDLEKMLCVLDFQYQWTQVFTPENGLEQILESALKITGAERAFIMTRKSDGFGYAAGLDGKGRRLSEGHFQMSQSVVRDVASNEKPVFMVEGIPANFAEQASIVAMNLRAIACMPLRGIPTDGDSPQILGILYLDSTKAMHSLSGLDQKILRKLAVEASNVLERVEMIKTIEHRKNLERDLSLAEEIQRSLLPHELPQLENFVLLAFSRPTRYVGGDFYDFYVTESQELIGILADVSGKGTAASLLSSMILGCLQLLLRGGHSPEEALDRLNKFLIEKASGKFATMFVFALQADGNGKFVSAGHNPAYLFRASRHEVEELPSNSLIIGAFDFAAFTATDVVLQPGDVLLVYSDGLTEAEDQSGNMFGEDRVKDIILREAPSGAEQLSEAILLGIQEFTRGRAQTDDITFVIAQRV